MLRYKDSGITMLSVVHTYIYIYIFFFFFFFFGRKRRRQAGLNEVQAKWVEGEAGEDER